MAVRMTCVGGVREHDETRKCEGNNTMREGKLAVGVVAVLQGLYRTKHGISRYQAAPPPATRVRTQNNHSWHLPDITGGVRAHPAARPSSL